MRKTYPGAGLVRGALRILVVTVVVFTLGCVGDVLNDISSHDEIHTVVVTPDSVSIQVGATVQLTAKAFNDENKEMTDNIGSVFWTAITGLGDIVSVGQGGVVTGLKAGSALVTGTIGDKHGTAHVTVTAAPPAAAGLIAYSTTVAGNGDVYTIEPDGDEESETRMIHTDAIENQPAWTRDGTALAFASKLGTVSSISYINMSNPQVILPVLVDSVSAIHDPAWSPDGTKLAYVRDLPSGKSNIFIVNRDGTNSHNISNTSSFSDIQPAWSPDGTKILFASDRDAKFGPGQYLEVYTMNVDGTHITRLTNNDNGIDYYPSWSPDGSKIAFTSDRAGNPQAYFGALDIWIMNADGSNLRNLTNNSRGDASPTWSPDGTQIAFITDRVQSQAYSWDIWIIDVTGANPRPLTHGGRETGPVWRP